MKHRIRDLLCVCSTPFGIIEGNTPSVRKLRRCKVVCSTPFGIMEGNTSNHFGPIGLGVGCSTPFGIMEGITPSSIPGDARPHAGPVLNAFRHH